MKAHVAHIGRGDLRSVSSGRPGARLECKIGGRVSPMVHPSYPSYTLILGEEERAGWGQTMYFTAPCPPSLSKRKVWADFTLGGSTDGGAHSPSRVPDSLLSSVNWIPVPLTPPTSERTVIGSGAERHST